MAWLGLGGWIHPQRAVRNKPTTLMGVPRGVLSILGYLDDDVPIWLEEDAEKSILLLLISKQTRKKTELDWVGVGESVLVWVRARESESERAVVLLLCQRLLSLPTITQPARWVTTTMPERFSSTISETINLPQGPQVYTQRILFHEIVPRKYRTNTSQNIPGAYISSHTYEYHYIVVHRCQPMEQSTT